MIEDLDYWSVVRNWPEGRPLLSFVSDSRYAALAVSFEEILSGDFFNAAWPQKKVPRSLEKPFERGFMGVVSYDDFSEQADVASHPSRIFRVTESLTFDLKKKMAHYSGKTPLPDWLSQLLNKSKSARPDEVLLKPIFLKEEKSRAHYVSLVKKAKQDIKMGRFYQINLLRFFEILQPFERDEVIERMKLLGGPFSSIFECHKLKLYSFSPERFLRVTPHQRYLAVETFPIKGTVGRFDDSYEDQKAKDQLMSSQKELAELNIIIDLLRNDLNRISQKATVEVVDQGSIRSYETLHHRVAHIRCKLDTTLSLGDIFKRVFPGGSITGAPKKEVMRAIHQSEKRSRGYFMGSAFILDESGYFDSSILIRTIVRHEENSYEYAAGSGIVLDSDPENEFEEINTKCRVLTD